MRIEQIEAHIIQDTGLELKILDDWERDSYGIDAQTADLFWEYIDRAKKIYIIGDYDADGICASHILSQSIGSVYRGKKIRVRTPRRFSEGYGLNDAIVDEILAGDIRGMLVITVDNGISASESLKRLREAGCKVIVTDHHALASDAIMPEVDMLIDPVIESLPNPFVGRYWCGAAVIYKLCEPMIPQSLAHELQIYAGLATVADVMPLREGNWGLVRRSLRAFREKKAPFALSQILRLMGKDPDFCDEEHFSYYLAPVLNAPGRLLDKGAVEVLKYLAQPTEEGALRLVELNTERKKLRDREYMLVRNEICKISPLPDVLWVVVSGLHEGLVGILAGMAAEEFKRPSVILTDVEQKPGILKGSARSFGDFDLFKYLSSMKESFLKMGGHKGAAGLSMQAENLEQVMLFPVQDNAFLNDEVHNNGYLIEKYQIPALYHMLEKYRPFGEGNKAPLFEVEVDIEKDNVRMVGEDKNHLLVQDKERRYKLIHFRHEPNSLSNPSHFLLRGHIMGDVFNGMEIPCFSAAEACDM